MNDMGFSGVTVASFESRMATEIARLIERYGGRPLVVPALREIPFENDTVTLQFGAQLMAGHFEMLIFLTGVGTSRLLQILLTRYTLDEIKTALTHTNLVARGPKPAAALKEFGLTPTMTIPEPNTWRDILRSLDQQRSLNDVRIAVQEYGVSNGEFLAALRQRGAEVTPVQVYKWALPEDLGPMKRLLDSIIAGQVQVLLVTNAAQVDHVMHLLATDGKSAPFLAALKKMVVVSIGPTASECLRRFGWPTALESSRPKMGHLVREAAELARTVLGRRIHLSLAD